MLKANTAPNSIYSAYSISAIRSVLRGVSNCSSCSVRINQVTVRVCHTTSLSDRILSGCVGVVGYYPMDTEDYHESVPVTARVPARHE